MLHSGFKGIGSSLSLLAGEQVVVTVPSDMRARFIIDSVATYVMVDGCSFEQALMTREAGNPEFMFLFDLGCPEHAYYRWRLYSLAQVAAHFRPSVFEREAPIFR